MSNANSIPPDQAPEIRSKILTQLVDEQLLLSEAQKKKIDRSPQVISAIDRARREIIVRAYVEQIANQQPAPDENAVNAYYQKHPELFAERRIYSVREMTVPKAGEATVHDFVAANKTMDQLIQALADQGIAVRAEKVDRAPETLPIEFVPQIASARDGALLTRPVEVGVYVVQVLGSRPMPVSLAEATPSIQRFLQNLSAREALSQELARLKNENKIEYFGEFAQNSQNGEHPAEATRTKPVSTPELDAATIKNGMTGIK